MSHQKVVTTSGTVTTGSAYSAGQIVGGLLQFSSTTRINAGTAMLLSSVLTDKAKQSANMSLVLFNANPTGTTVTDKVALNVVAADLAKIIGVLTFPTASYTPFASSSACMLNNLWIPINLISGTTLFGILMTTGTPTFTTATDVAVSLGFDIT